MIKKSNQLSTLEQNRFLQFDVPEVKNLHLSCCRDSSIPACKLLYSYCLFTILSTLTIFNQRVNSKNTFIVGTMQRGSQISDLKNLTKYLNKKPEEILNLCGLLHGRVIN